MLLTTIDFVSGDIFLTPPFTNEGGGGRGGGAGEGVLKS